MPIYYAVGNALVEEPELREKESLGQIADFNEAVIHKPNAARVEFSTGVLTTENRLEGFRTSEVIGGQPVPFQELGIGKPLAVEIRRIYTGQFPKVGWLGRGGDMLVTSAMKSIAAFNAAPRAMNFLRSDVPTHSAIAHPAATERGTPIVFYSPALTEHNSVVTIEFGFDEFNSDIVNFLSGAFQSAAGIPIFMAASNYLMAASAIIKLVGNLGTRLIDRGPVFRASEPIQFLRAGAIKSEAGFALLSDRDMPRSVLNGYSLDQNGDLVDASGQLYRGNHPYCVISLDGNKVDSYKEFTATAASAALLERFFRIGEDQSQPLGPLVDALKLYNDWKFRQKADDLKGQLSQLAPGSDEHKRKTIAYEAAIKNILNDLLKPK